MGPQSKLKKTLPDLPHYILGATEECAHTPSVRSVKPRILQGPRLSSGFHSLDSSRGARSTRLRLGETWDQPLSNWSRAVLCNVTCFPHSHTDEGSGHSSAQFGSNSAALKEKKKSLPRSQEDLRKPGGSGDPGSWRKAQGAPTCGWTPPSPARPRGRGRFLPPPGPPAPVPAPARRRPSAPALQGYLQVIRGGCHGGDPRRFFGEERGHRTNRSDVESSLGQPQTCTGWRLSDF